MAADQLNKQWFTYVDLNGQAWNKLGNDDAACHAIDGSAAAVGGQPDYPRATRRRQPREAIFTDPTTFRQKSCIIYTEAALAAITAGATIAVHVPGETATVSYTLSAKRPDKAPVRSTARQLADHA